MFPDLTGVKLIGIDLENRDPYLTELGPSYLREDGHIAGYSLGIDKERSWYFPFAHDEADNLSESACLDFLKPIWNDPEITKVFANAMYDIGWLMSYGFNYPAGRIIDVLAVEALINPNSYSYSLDTVSKKYLHEGKLETEMLQMCAEKFGGKPNSKQKANIWRLHPDYVKQYAAWDAAAPVLIWLKQEPLIAKYELAQVLELEMDLLPMLLDMRKRGILLNIAGAQTTLADYEFNIECLQEAIGPTINVNSAASLSRLARSRNLPISLTAKGSPSFTKDYTKKHMPDVLELKNLKKLVGTFLKGYFIDAHYKERIYPSFHPLKSQTEDEKGVSGTVTRRFSCSDPNIQNIPEAMRKLMLPEPGEMWVSLDYRQVEFGAMLHYASHPSAINLRAQYDTDPSLDFHTVVATAMKTERKLAKAINFMIIYGGGTAKLAMMLGISVAEATKLMANYHETFPFAKELRKKASALASRRGYIRTYWGGRASFELYEPWKWDPNVLPLPWDEALLKWGAGKIKRAGTRNALNYLIQGSCADIMKLSMIRIWKSGLCAIARPLATIHDELCFSVPPTKEGEECIKNIRHIMETMEGWRVPLPVTISVGRNFGELNECKYDTIF